jgi:hypothetical protein
MSSHPPAPSGPRGNAARGNGAGGGDPRADATRGNDPRSDAAPAAGAGRTSAAGKPHRGRQRSAPAANPAARGWTGVLPTPGTNILRTGASCPAGVAAPVFQIPPPPEPKRMLARCGCEPPAFRATTCSCSSRRRARRKGTRCATPGCSRRRGAHRAIGFPAGGRMM